VTERSLVELYVNVCEELSLSDDQRRQLWLAICEEIERVEAELPDPANATVEEIEAVCDRLAVPAIRALIPGPQPAMTASLRAAELPPDGPPEVLLSHWNLIEGIVTRVRNRLRADEEEADTVESRVKLKLFADDYMIVRNFKHRSSFRSYLTTIVTRTFHDLRVERFGKWHHSAAALRLGPLALELERMIYKEGYAPSEAISVLLTAHPEISPVALEHLLEELPVKQRRPSKVPMEDVSAMLSTDPDDILWITGERLRLSERTAMVVRRFMDNLEESDRTLLQLFFEAELKISTIARMYKKDQKTLYRRRNDLLAQLRKELFGAGIGRTEAADLYHHIAKISDFGFGKDGK
jgi:RNA polymerase sigma factor (sigma-70 family)